MHQKSQQAVSFPEFFCSILVHIPFVYLCRTEGHTMVWSPARKMFLEFRVSRSA